MNKQETIIKLQELRLRINLIESQLITQTITLNQAESMMRVVEKEIRFLEDKVLN